MINKITTSLIISTYNWPEALELVLLSVKNQSVIPNEVIIADDGSINKTKNLINQLQKEFPCPLIHVWHEDKGFRKSIILNKAVVHSNNEYIIQVDGDCILHPNFIKDHIRNIESQTFLYGARVNIQKQYLHSLFKNKQTFFTPFSKGIKKRGRAFYFPKLNFSKPKLKLSPKFRGCNTSFWKKDLITVNGYNEDFKGWGREDSELMLRMTNNNIKSKRLKHEGIVFHIYHNEESKDNLTKNDSIEDNTRTKKLTFCPNGINKYLINENN